MAKTLLEQTADLVEQAQGEALRRRQAAGEELKALLLRNSNPRKGDEARLVELLPLVGLKPEDLPEVLELLQNIAKAEAICARADEIRSDDYQAQTAVNAVEAWRLSEHERIDREALVKLSEAQSVRGKTKALVRELDTMWSQEQKWSARWRLIRDGFIPENDGAFQHLPPELQETARRAAR